MQSVIHAIHNIHPIFDDFDRLYNQLSVKVEEKSNNLFSTNIYSPIFSELYDMFVTHGHIGNIQYLDKSYSPLKVPQNTENNIIVCFSGGKDSTAVAKHYMEEGKNVFLYHMKNINPSMVDEAKISKDIADYLGLPIYIDTIKLSGHHDYIEHPMKNMIILNSVLQYGIREGIGVNIATGNYKTSTLADDNFEFCGGDDIEMWEIYDKIIGNVLQDFHVQIPLDSLDDSLEAVCYDWDLLDKTVSCLSRASLRNHWHEWVKNKYGITIPKYRCGRCYKCCIEYIYMADNDLIPYNEEYYKYCFINLRRNFQREDNNKYTNREVWEHYFGYSMEESKYFNTKIIRNYHMSRKTDVQ